MWGYPYEFNEEHVKTNVWNSINLWLTFDQNCPTLKKNNGPALTNVFRTHLEHWILENFDLMKLWRTSSRMFWEKINYL